MKAGWRVVPLGDLCRIEIGSTPSRSIAAMWDEKRETSNVWLSIADLPQTLHAVVLDSKEYVSDKAASGMRLVPKGTLLVSFKLTLGRLAYAGKDLFTNEAIASLLDLDASRINQRFLYWALTQFDWNKAAEGDEKVKGKTLNKAKLKVLPIPLPSLDEQKRIVAVLDEAFEGLSRARANAKANLADARELFARHAASVFNRIAREANSRRSVAEIAASEKGSIRTGPFGSQLLHSEFVDSGVAVLGIDNAVKNEFQWAKRRFITEEKYKELSRYRVRPGDVIITIMGTCGRCAVVPDDIPKAINTKHLCCITLDQGLCIPDFLHAYFLYSPVARDYLSSQVLGSIMDGLNMGIIKELPVTLPSLSAQRDVVSAISEMRRSSLELETSYAKNIAELDTLRQSLLQKAFSGELT